MYFNLLLLQAMYELLTSVATSLVKTMIAYPTSSYLVKVLVLLMIFYKCEMLDGFSTNKSNRATISYLLRYLAIKDDQVVKANFFIHYHVSFEKILNMLIPNAALKFNPPIIEWIFAVPLLHLTVKKCKPFDQLEGLSWELNESIRYVTLMLYMYMYV